MEAEDGNASETENAEVRLIQCLTALHHETPNLASPPRLTGAACVQRTIAAAIDTTLLSRGQPGPMSIALNT